MKDPSDLLVISLSLFWISKYSGSERLSTIPNIKFAIIPNQSLSFLPPDFIASPNAATKQPECLQYTRSLQPLPFQQLNRIAKNSHRFRRFLLIAPAQPIRIDLLKLLSERSESVPVPVRASVTSDNSSYLTQTNQSFYLSFYLSFPSEYSSNFQFPDSEVPAGQRALFSCRIVADYL